jgi:hypothetical protein
MAGNMNVTSKGYQPQLAPLAPLISPATPKTPPSVSTTQAPPSPPQPKLPSSSSSFRPPPLVAARTNASGSGGATPNSGTPTPGSQRPLPAQTSMFTGSPSTTTSQGLDVASNSGGASGSRGSVQLPADNKVAINPGPSRTNKSTATADPLSAAGKLVGAVLPDALVYTNSAMLATPNKQFVLVNPAGFGSPTGRGATLFTSHTGSLNGKTPGGLAMNRVSARHFNLSGQANGIEEGQGVVQKTGQGDKEVTFFLNTRAGTTAAGKNGNLSAQFGWFGSAAAMKGLIAKMPSSGAAGLIKKGLEKAADSGSKFGVAYRGTASVDPKTGKWTLKASGVEIPLPDSLKGDSTPTKGIKPALNFEQKPIARINNEDAYKAGANPFQRAEDTREGSGKYVNHTDPVARIAGDVLTLQDTLGGKGQAGVRTNAQAASVVEQAIDRRDAISPEKAANSRFHMGATVSNHLMGPGAKARLDQLLVQLDRYGLSFGSSKVKQAAHEAAQAAGDVVKPPGKEDKAFVRDVFQGTYRLEPKAQQAVKDSLNWAKDMVVGTSKVATVVEPLIFPEAAGTNSGMVTSVAAKGFEQRMKAGAGGTLSALGIAALPPGRDGGAPRAEYERVATNQLISQLIPKLKTRDADGSRLYEAFKLLSAPERQAIAAEVRKRTDERVDADSDTADPLGRAEVRKRDLLQ